MQEQDALSLADLPDETLQLVFALVGREHLASLSTVCKKWGELIITGPDCWRFFSFDAGQWGAGEAGQRAAAKQRLLPRVARFVTTAALVGQGAQLLGQLQPGLMTELSLTTVDRPLTISAVEAVGRMAGLTSLHLGASGLPPTALAAALASLAQLHVLSFTLCGEAAQRHLHQTMHHTAQFWRLPPQLTAVHIRADEDGLPELSAALAALTQLRSLSLHTHPNRPPPGLLPALLALTRLESLKLHMLGPLPLGMPDLTQLGRLRELTLHCRGGQAPLPSAFPAPLERFDYQGTQPEFEIGGATVLNCSSGDDGQSFEVGRLAEWDSIGGLLAAVLPPGTPPYSLLLCRAQIEAPPPQDSLAALAHLTALRLRSCTGFQAGGMAAALEALAAACPLLAELEVEQCGAMPVPPAFGASLLQLRSLRLLDCRLTSLAPGAYLSGLCRLDLSGNVLTCVPPALSAAAALEALAISSNRHLAAMDDIDEGGVLLGLTRLRRLALRGNFLTRLPAAACLPGLECLDFGGNSLTRLPAELARATALTALRLDGNRQLGAAERAEAGVNVLLRLPRLRLLDLSGTAAAAAPASWAGVRQRLLVGLPGLDLRGPP